MSDEKLCPCGSGQPLDTCCGPILKDITQAKTAVQLMRARYTAYALVDIDFLYTSSGDQLRTEFDAENSRKWATSATWTGLDIVSTHNGGATDETGIIEFIAHYTMGENVFDHHERASFARVDGAWRFIDGVIFGQDPIRRDEPKIGRNDLCPCGSGKKYKKCCGSQK